MTRRLVVNFSAFICQRAMCPTKPLHGWASEPFAGRLLSRRCALSKTWRLLVARTHGLSAAKEGICDSATFPHSPLWSYGIERWASSCAFGASCRWWKMVTRSAVGCSRAGVSSSHWRAISCM